MHKFKGGAAVTKRELTALERVFAAEIQNRLPFQSKARVFKELCASGHLEFVERYVLGSDRFGAITVSGYFLTDAGRMAYCEWASTQPETDPDAR